MGHTQGPWAYDTDMVGYEMPNRQYYARIYAVNPGLEYDFTVGFARDADPAQRAANAALLAAAPDLLEALEEIVSSMDAIMDAIASPSIQVGDDDFYALTQAKRAISRAKGGQ